MKADRSSLFPDCSSRTDRNPGTTPRSRVLRTLASLLAVTTIGLLGAGQAQAERAFEPRFSQNVQGEITIAANTVMTCPDSDSRCPAAQAGTGSALNNNQFRMRYVDVDEDPSTFNSSTAELMLPQGATVLFAGLYYGAKTSAGAGGSQAPDTAARGTVKLLTPGGASYAELTAEVDDSTEVSRAYGAFVDVTGVVQGAGPGEYAVANVQAGTGEDRYGGWSLVVAYRDPDEPARNLTIFDGLQNLTGSKPALTIGVTGFQTPASGPVRTNLGFVSFEGDRGAAGDSATLNGQVLSTVTNPPNNFFNSSISKDGVPVDTKDPDYDNQLGYDSILMNADGFLPNAVDNAAIRLQTTSDVYLPQVITFATELFSPVVTATKSVENVTDPGQGPEEGDTLRYTVTYTNSGGDGATQFTAEDAIPVGTTYAPGTLEITAGPDPSPLTDAIGDDRAEYLPASSSVRFRLGQGANETTGGLLTAAGGAAPTSTVTFEVTVDSGLSSGTAIINTATGSFLSQTLGTDQSVESNEVLLEVLAPDLVMSKDHADPPPGGPVTFTLGVANGGSAPTDGAVTVTDSFPAAAFSSITITSSTGWDCSATMGLDLSCTRSDPLASGASYPPIEVEAAVVGSPPALFSNTATVTGGGDPNPVNNVAIDYLPAPPATSDLAVTKVVDQATVATGARVSWTIVVRNNGPSPATGVTLTDSLPAEANTDVQVFAGQGTCEVTATPAVECAIGSLEPTAAVGIVISAIVTADDTTGIENTATVSGDQIDTRPNNDEATATFDAAATADLSIAKTADPDPIAGESFSYTLTVTNDGPSAASDLVVSDQIPALFTPTSITAPDFTCGGLPAAGGTLGCLYTGSLASGGSATIELTGDLAGASAGVAVINTATVSSAAGDPDPTDNSSSVTITPLPFADLSVGKVASRDEVDPGEAFSYSLVVNNAGPLAAEPVTLVDEMPAGFQVLEFPDECSLSGRTLTCALGTVAVGETKRLTVTGRARSNLAGTNLLNTVSVTAPQPDPVPESAFDRWVTRVGTGKVKAGLVQKVKRQKVRSGRNDRLEIVVRNRSSNAITDARVCQRLPRQLVVVSARSQNLLSRSRNEVCWTIALLEPGAAKTYGTLVRAISPKPVTVRVEALLSGGNANRATDRGKVRIVPAGGRNPRPPTG